MKTLSRFALLAASILGAGAAAAASVMVNPALPTYGQNVTVELQDMPFPTYLPATRYVKNGSTIVVEYEFAPDPSGARRADFGSAPLALGELAPGTYTVQARLFNMANPKSPAESTTRNIAVLPPEQWGLYAVPRQPDAFATWEVVVRSAVYFDPTSMRARVDGNVVRIDFDYDGAAPVGGNIPPGMTSFAAVKVPGLQPGNYRVEGWGRERKGSVSEMYFTRDVGVSSSVAVVEYYSPALDHYFMTAAADEIDLIERGLRGDWQRTGHRFKAWLRASDASPFAKPVCRFYSTGVNSHFYTGDPKECEFLKALEHSQRAEANARGQPFRGWAYEGIAFHAVVPEYGACPGGMTAVYRAFNNRAAQMDSNHRFTVEHSQRLAMSMSWVDEGAAFCSPP